jgi:hypothetical protein
MIRSKRGAVRIGHKARQRKAEWERENGGTVHLIVYDDREVFAGCAHDYNACDWTKRRVYYTRRIGNLSVSTMHPVRSVQELRALIATPDDELPEAARRDRP